MGPRPSRRPRPGPSALRFWHATFDTQPSRTPCRHLVDLYRELEAVTAGQFRSVLQRTFRGERRCHYSNDQPGQPLPEPAPPREFRCAPRRPTTVALGEILESHRRMMLWNRQTGESHGLPCRLRAAEGTSDRQAARLAAAVDHA